jgi:hypothetical protein
MTKSRKHQSEPGAPDDHGNIGSGENMEQVHPWTDEEMAASKPLPLPTVKLTPQVTGVAGVPYVGKGKTKSGGRPENGETKH